MGDQRKPSPQEDLHQRIDKAASFLERLEIERHTILAQGKVAPSSCWIVRYLALRTERNLLVLQITSDRTNFSDKD